MAKPDIAQPDERTRQHRALKLRLEGKTWAAIAAELDYADHTGPYHAVSSLLDRQESESAQEYRQMEDMRLDALLAKYWPDALAGDLKAAEFVARLHDRRVKLHGLAAPTRVMVGGLAQAEFETTVEADIRALGVDPGMDTPLEDSPYDAADPWSNL